MNWLVFALVSIVSISVANLFQKMAMKSEESDPVASSIFFQFLSAIFTGIFASVNGFTLPPVNLLFPYFLISTLLYAFGTLFIFKAIKAIEASELVIVSSFSAIATITSAYLFLGERLNFIQIIGAFLIFSAVFMIKHEKKKVRLDKGLLFALLGNFLYGLAVTNDAFILKNYQAISYAPIMLFLPGVILCLIYSNKTREIILKFKNNFNLNLGAYSFLYGIQAVTYYLALQGGALASQMGTIFKSEIILTVILASLYLRERKNLFRKLLAAGIAITGVILAT